MCMNELWSSLKNSPIWKLTQLLQNFFPQKFSLKLSGIRRLMEFFICSKYFQKNSEHVRSACHVFLSSCNYLGISQKYFDVFRCSWMRFEVLLYSIGVCFLDVLGTSFQNHPIGDWTIYKVLEFFQIFSKVLSSSLNVIQADILESSHELGSFWKLYFLGSASLRSFGKLLELLKAFVCIFL